MMYTKIALLGATASASGYYSRCKYQIGVKDNMMPRYKKYNLQTRKERFSLKNAAHKFEGQHEYSDQKLGLATNLHFKYNIKDDYRWKVVPMGIFDLVKERSISDRVTYREYTTNTAWRSPTEFDFKSTNALNEEWTGTYHALSTPHPELETIVNPEEWFGKCYPQYMIHKPKDWASEKWREDRQNKQLNCYPTFCEQVCHGSTMVKQRGPLACAHCTNKVIGWKRNGEEIVRRELQYFELHNYTTQEEMEAKFIDNEDGIGLAKADGRRFFAFDEDTGLGLAIKICMFKERPSKDSYMRSETSLQPQINYDLAHRKYYYEGIDEARSGGAHPKSAFGQLLKILKDEGTPIFGKKQERQPTFIPRSEDPDFFKTEAQKQEKQFRQRSERYSSRQSGRSSRGPGRQSSERYSSRPSGRQAPSSGRRARGFYHQSEEKTPEPQPDLVDESLRLDQGMKHFNKRKMDEAVRLAAFGRHCAHDAEKLRNKILAEEEAKLKDELQSGVDFWALSDRDSLVVLKDIRVYYPAFFGKTDKLTPIFNKREQNGDKKTAEKLYKEITRRIHPSMVSKSFIADKNGDKNLNNPYNIRLKALGEILFRKLLDVKQKIIPDVKQQ